MLFGKVPFQGRTDIYTFNFIVRRELKFPQEQDNISEDAIDLIAQLLSLLPNLRGADDYPALKAHPFFHGIDFSSLSSDTTLHSYFTTDKLERKNSWVDVSSAEVCEH